MHILLGSNSPRRRELLGGLDVDFEVVRIDADESYPAELRAGDIPLYIAKAKADAFCPETVAGRLSDPYLLLTADTIVWCDGQMLGKPHDEADAHRMLRLLSGKTHQVYTAVYMRAFDPNTGEEKERTDLVDCTDVTFRELSDEEIDYYIERYKPFDKAGAYGIQEWIGYIGCTGLNGSYFNVVGFPVEKVYEKLKKYGF